MIILVPFDIGQEIYKICPKCNENHNGTCKHCAWAGCFTAGCDVGVRIYSDGSFGDYKLQIRPYKVTEYNFFTVKNNWNTMFFATQDEAEKALKEYDEIRKIANRDERIKRYDIWVEMKRSEIK